MSNAECIASSQFSTLGVVGPERLPPEVVELLTLALRRGATDILLAVDRPPSFRVSATLTPVEELQPPGPDAIVRLAHTLLGERGIAELEQQRDRDFAFEVTGLTRFRGSFYYKCAPQLALSLEAVLSLALLPRVGSGLALATEIMIATPAIRAMIRDGRAHQIYAAIQTGHQAGMRTMNSSLAGLVKRRQITLEDAEARSPDVKELRQLLAL